MQKRSLFIFLIVSLKVYCGKDIVLPMIEDRFINKQESCCDNSSLAADLVSNYRYILNVFKKLCEKSSELSYFMDVLETDQKCGSNEHIDLLLKQVDDLLKNKNNLDQQWAQIENKLITIQLRACLQDKRNEKRR